MLTKMPSVCGNTRLPGARWVFAGLAVACVVAAGTPRTAEAAFVLFEDFQALTPGNLNGQGGWTANATNVNVATVSGTLVAQVGQPAAVASNYRGLGGSSIANGTTGTVFFQWQRGAGNGPNYNIGLTDLAAPGNVAGDFEIQLNMQATGVLNARSAGAFVGLAFTNGGPTFVPLTDTMYNFWLVVDNTADTYQVWVQSDGDANTLSQVQLVNPTGGSGTFGFRNGVAANSIQTFLFGAGATTNNALIAHDNIYVDTAGANLANPIPEPAGIAAVALGLGLAGFAVARRRRFA